MAIDLDEIVEHYNIAEELSNDELRDIGFGVVEDYDNDLNSRLDWEDNYEKYLKLASQVVEHKTFPWNGAANIKYPLLTTAGLQFHARAYPALVPSTQVVQAKVLGADEDGEKRKKAIRISRHMTYQVKDEMQNWEEEHDKLLLTLAFTGCEFKKSYFDPDLGVNQAVHVQAKDLVVNYWAKSIEKAGRKTEKMEYSYNELIEQMRSGTFLDVDLNEDDSEDPDNLRIAQDEVRGIKPPVKDDDTPHLVLEYHGYWDLDEDGYREPYIITVHYKSKKVLRIKARFQAGGIVRNDDNEIQRIEPDEYYTQYNFIPDPNGGIYGVGFGILLSPINETANTLINQLLDAGTLSNLPSGFLSREMRIRGGNLYLKPGEFKMLNATGDALKNGIMPMPVNAPSTVLMSLLQLMINAGERMSSTTDIMVGENPGQNQKATTSAIVQQEGQRVFTAIYKRIRRSMDKEFKKLFKLNSIYLPIEVTQFNDEETGLALDINAEDYDTYDLTVTPSADPTVATEQQRIQKAQMLLEMMQTGGFNVYEVKRRFLEAMEVPGIEMVLPDPKGPNAIPTPPPIEAVKEDNEEKEREFRRQFEMKEHSDLMTLEAAKLDAVNKKIVGDMINNLGTLELGDKKIENDKQKANNVPSGNNARSI